MLRILQISSPKEIRQIMQEIKVDPYGIKIMTPKGVTHTIRINALSSIAANILKQEMLSLGADAAVAREALTGRSKQTDCLLLGNLAQFSRLEEKLNRQPFGLDRLGRQLAWAVGNYEKDSFTLELGRHKLILRPGQGRIMGIVNLTPDSFSGDGLLSRPKAKGQRLNEVVDYTEQLVKDGADIIDLGGESSRPGARPVSLKEELARTIPAIKMLARKIKVPISIDTSKPEVARQALDNGAVMVNDISGLRNTQMAKIAARYKAGVVLMHMRGEPRNMQQNPLYDDLLGEVIEYLQIAIQRAAAGGISKEKIIIDPGIGFGKTLEHNLEILKRMAELKILGRPILVGTSRKSFLGKILHRQPQERIFGTVSSCVLAVKNGAHLVRAHDVREVSQSLKVLAAIEKR